MWLIFVFFLAFAAGFFTIWSLDFSDDIDVIMFEDQEELDAMCWQGLHNQRFK